MIGKHNSIKKQYGFQVVTVIFVLHISYLAGIAHASSTINDLLIYTPDRVESFADNQKQPEKIKQDAFEKGLWEKNRDFSLLGIPIIPYRIDSHPLPKPTIFERDFIKFGNMPSVTGGSSLPMRVPEVDNPPYLHTVHLSNIANSSGCICFTGAVEDDLRLKNIRAVVRTPTGTRFEVLNAPISGYKVDLLDFCMGDIGDLGRADTGDYIIVLSVKDSANQLISKTFHMSAPLCLGCRQDMHGGQCVNFVRTFFGGRYDFMPGLCIYDDCGAYHAWKEWDLGYGKGRIPAKKSILVLDKKPLLYGHVAVVMNQKLNDDNTYTLTVDESNWDRDELIDCGVQYTYFPETAKAIRQGSRKVYNVAGFIYTEK